MSLRDKNLEKLEGFCTVGECQLMYGHKGRHSDVEKYIDRQINMFNMVRLESMTIKGALQTSKFNYWARELRFDIEELYEGSN